MFGTLFRSGELVCGPKSQKTEFSENHESPGPFMLFEWTLESYRELITHCGDEVGQNKCIWAGEWAIHQIIKQSDLLVLFIDVPNIHMASEKSSLPRNPYRVLGCSDQYPSHFVILALSQEHFRYYSHNGETQFLISEMPVVVKTLFEAHLRAQNHVHIKKVVEGVYEHQSHYQQIISRSGDN